MGNAVNNNDALNTAWDIFVQKFKYYWVEMLKNRMDDITKTYNNYKKVYD